jgi:hypothetical protein
VILHIRVVDLDRHQWTRVSSGSFWAFESRRAEAHGRARAVAITTQRI